MLPAGTPIVARHDENARLEGYDAKSGWHVHAAVINGPVRVVVIALASPAELAGLAAACLPDDPDDLIGPGSSAGTLRCRGTAGCSHPPPGTARPGNLRCPRAPARAYGHPLSTLSAVLRSAAKWFFPP